MEIEDDTFVYVDENGQKVTGWKTINGRKHYFYEDGIMATGTIEVDGDKYYLDEYGVLYTGWQYDADDNAYYHDEFGKRLKDTTKEIDGVEYVFDEDGVATDKETLDAQKEEEEQRRQEEQRASSSSSTSSKGNTSYGNVGNGIANAALAQLGVNPSNRKALWGSGWRCLSCGAHGETPSIPRVVAATRLWPVLQAVQSGVQSDCFIPFAEVVQAFFDWLLTKIFETS